MTTEMIDVTGLPGPVVNSLRALVDSLRGQPDPMTPPELPAGWERVRAAVSQSAAHPRNSMTPEERIAAWKAWAADHAVPGVVIDDSRETFYEGRE